jgi:hypothetical protein
MTEAEVVAAFGRWLAADGWVVGRSTDRDLDIYATRAGQRLHVEAKGVTKDPYTSADIGWGQLLRRMSDLGQPGARYGVVCPLAMKATVLRVPAVVRERLGVEVFVVNPDGSVDPS